MYPGASAAQSNVIIDSALDMQTLLSLHYTGVTGEVFFDGNGDRVAYVLCLARPPGQVEPNLRSTLGIITCSIGKPAALMFLSLRCTYGAVEW